MFRRGRSLGQRVGAGVAVLLGGQVLLVQRRDNGLWDIPGGAVEPGEEVRTAALRELTEETGVRVSDVRLLDVFSGPHHHHVYPDGNQVDWITVLYTTFLPERELVNLQPASDASQAAWWPLDALPQQVSAATRAYFTALLGHARGQG